MATKISPRKCSGCKNILPKREHLRCEVCKGIYDLECANVSLILFHLMERKNAWKCPECLCKRPKVGNLNTPVRSSSPNDIARETGRGTPPSPTAEGSQNVTVRSKPIKNVSHDFESDTIGTQPIVNLNSPTSSEIQLFWNDIKAFRLEISKFRETMDALTNTIK